MAATHFVWLGLFALSLPAFSQGERTPVIPALSSPPVADARITLDVVVNDKEGKPVIGLDESKFTILDNKQPDKIVSFEAVGGAGAAENGAEIVLVMDEVNTAFGRVAYERDQIKKVLLRDNGKLTHPVSIDFLSDSGLNVQNDASRDGNALISYMAQHETALHTIHRSAGFYGANDRAQISLRALAELATYEAKRPGRKIVVWISPGWPLLSGPNVQLSPKDERKIFDTVVALSTQLRQSRITLNSVDPLGTADSGGYRIFYYEQFLKGLTAPKQAQFGNLALQVFARQSGGRVLNASNDVSGEIGRCFRDADAYYKIAFDARPADGPNEYHALEVKLSQSGLKTQTRSGYYAQPVPEHTPEQSEN